MRRRTAIGMLAVAAMVGAGCGDAGGGDDPGTVPPTAVPTTRAPTTTLAPTTTVPPTTTTVPPTTTAGGAFCDELASLFLSPPPDDEAVRALRDLATEAPGELAGDFAAVIEAAEAAAGGVTEDTPELREAANAIIGFLRIDCGVDPTGLGEFGGGSYLVRFEGDVSGTQTGRVLCTFESDLEFLFTPDIDFEYRYTVVVDGFNEGRVDAEGPFELTNDDTGDVSTGTATVEGEIEYVNPKFEGMFTFEAGYAGPAGTGTVSGQFACPIDEIVE